MALKFSRVVFEIVKIVVFVYNLYQTENTILHTSSVLSYHAGMSGFAVI